MILDQATISYFQRPPDVAVRGHGRTWPSTLPGAALNSIVAIKSATASLTFTASPLARGDPQPYSLSHDMAASNPQHSSFP